MNQYPQVKRCVTCKWSTRDAGRSWHLYCRHPLVNINDSSYLSWGEDKLGTNCSDERKKNWTHKCGLKGKLYELDAK